MTFPLAARTDEIAPFLAMEVMERGMTMAREGVDVVQMGVGEPDFDAMTGLMKTTIVLNQPGRDDAEYAARLLADHQGLMRFNSVSGSGNSVNILRAMEYANGLDAETVGFCGYPGGKLESVVKHVVHANIHDMQWAEDVHLILGHIAMKILGGGACY